MTHQCKYIFLPLLLAFVSLEASFAQDDWALKMNSEGIKVYTKNLENSPYKVN